MSVSSNTVVDFPDLKKLKERFDGALIDAGNVIVNIGRINKGLLPQDPDLSQKLLTARQDFERAYHALDKALTLTNKWDEKAKTSKTYKGIVSSLMFFINKNNLSHE